MVGESLDMTKLVKIVIRNHVLCYVLISTTAYFQICGSWSTKGHPDLCDTAVCMTPECKNLANYYKKIINPFGDPCDDFYDYVCHRWSVEHPRPKHVDFWADHEVFRQNALSKVKNLLEDEGVSGPKYEQDAKSLYRACMNLPFKERIPPADVMKIMQTVGNWPMFIRNDVVKAQNVTWQYCEEKYINIAGESSLFDYSLRSYNRKGVHITPFLKQLESPHGMLRRVIAWNDKNGRNRYKAFLTKIIKTVAPVDVKKYQKTIDNDLDDVISFREELRNWTNTNKRIDVDTMTIAQFQEYYDSYRASDRTAKIDWSKVVRSMYKDSKDSSGATVKNTTLIQVQKQYFTKLRALLSNVTDRVVGNHVHLYFAERHLLLDEDMESELEKTLVDVSLPLGNLRYEPERWQTCILNMDMEDIIGIMYVNAYFSRNDQVAVTGMVMDGTGILKQQISECSWIDPLLVQTWKNKLNHLVTQIGYPMWYYNKSAASIKHTRTDVNPVALNVHYVPVLNKIGISAAYLQSPTYDAKLPYVIRYGSLLPSIGHELYHMLQYNVTNLEQNFRILNNASREKKMHEKFEKHVQCFTDQYKNYKLEFIKKRKLNINYYSQLTSNEDIPDVMGLKLAYRAYRNILSMNTCTILPGLKDLDCEQLFFIAFAKKYCAELSPITEQRIFMADVHSLPQIRVNAAVANMKEFARAFNCRSGDALVLNKTCDLWEV